MPDPYTINDPIREALARSRAADSSAARAAMAGPIPDPPKPPMSAPVAPPVTTPNTAAVNAAATPAGNTAKSLAYRAGQGTRVAGSLATGAAAASALTGFGDYQADTGGVDTSAPGTVGYLMRGEFANAGRSLSGGAAEALADSGRGIAKMVGQRDAYDGFVKDALGGYLSLREPGTVNQQQAAPIVPAGPVTTASKAGQRVSNIAQSNPELFDAPAANGRTSASAPGLAGVVGDTTSAPGIVKLTGGQFKTPMFTDDPARAANEYASKGQGVPTDRLTTVQSTANADRNYLAAAFARHAASGDLDRALATADPYNVTQQTAIGHMLRQNAAGQAQAAQEEPLRRAAQQAIDGAVKSQGNIRDFAFGGPFRSPRGGRGGAVQPDNSNPLAVAQMLQQSVAGTQRGGAERSPMALALEQANAQMQQQQGEQDNQIARTLKMSQAQSAKVMAELQTAFAKESDPAKREAISERIQVLSGKYEKPAASVKAILEDFDTGKTDMMGQPIYKKRAVNPETGEPITKTAAAPKATRESLDTEAKAAIAAGANKDAVNARLQQKIKELGL